MTSVRIGAFSVTLFRAGSYWWDGGAMFGVVPKTLWSKHQPCDDLNRIEAGFNCFLIAPSDRSGRDTVLIETGGGVRHDERARERMRLRTEALPDPAVIGTVINTHLHWDHAGGNTVDTGGALGGNADGTPGAVSPAFPNAEYWTQRGELMHAREQHPRDAVSYRAPNYEPLVESGRMRLLDGDSEIRPGIEVRVVPGHNRDMMVVLVRSGGETWCHMADLIPYAAQITPTWVSGFDLFPLETIAGKTRLLEEAASGNWWCSFGHDPAVAFAKIEHKGGKWQLAQRQS